MSARRAVSIGGALLALGSTLGMAQDSASGPRAPSPILYAVEGNVADDAGNFIGPAEIELLASDSVTRRYRSDENGRFRIGEIENPHVVFRVRRVGFQPATISVDVTAPSRLATVVVKLQPVVNALDPMHVEDTPPGPINANLVAFRNRASTNRFGHYVDEAELLRLRPIHASDALHGIPGLLITPSRRGGNQVMIRGCAPLVWVNGLRAPGQQIDDVVTSGADLAAIEIYNSFAGVPAQFLDRSATCGTILVWLK